MTPTAFFVATGITLAIIVLGVGLGVGLILGMSSLVEWDEARVKTREQRIRALADTIRNRMTDDDWAALQTPPRPPTAEETRAALDLITAEHAEDVAAEQRLARRP